jgi:hypothetical protein
VGRKNLFGHTGYNCSVDYYAANRLYYFIHDGSNSAVVNNASTYLGGAWHHFAEVLDGTNILAYVDGKFVAAASSTFSDMGREVHMTSGFMRARFRQSKYNRYTTQTNNMA